MAFSEKLREAVTKSHKISTGLIKEFILRPVQSFLHWDSLKSKVPSLALPDDSRMRERFHQYLGYERHRVKFDEDFWQRRQKNGNSLTELGQHIQGVVSPSRPKVGVSALPEKARGKREGV